MPLKFALRNVAFLERDAREPIFLSSLKKEYWKVIGARSGLEIVYHNQIKKDKGCSFS